MDSNFFMLNYDACNLVLTFLNKIANFTIIFSIIKKECFLKFKNINNNSKGEVYYANVEKF